MSHAQPGRRYQFGVFEAEVATGELRRKGIRVKLNAQPFQVLLMLLERPGELLTREEIASRLWPDGTFVDYEHGVNSAVNRIREALGDAAGNPRFIETLARRGYRFIAPVNVILPNGSAVNRPLSDAASPSAAAELPPNQHGPGLASRILASPEELPEASHPLVQSLFIAFQLMYLAFYVSALANLGEIEQLLSPVPRAAYVFGLVFITAGMLIPARAFLLFAVLFHAPGFRAKFLRIWGVLLMFDLLWSLSPFLLLHHISFGLALAAMALLVYSPFVQRSLVLMGAGGSGL